MELGESAKDDAEHHFGRHRSNNVDMDDDDDLMDGMGDDDDEEEITSVQRGCSAAEDFYQIQPSATSLVDEMNMMSPFSHPMGHAARQDDLLINGPNHKTSIVASSQQRTDVDKSFFPIGLHHPEGTSQRPRDEGGFLLTKQTTTFSSKKFPPMSETEIRSSATTTTTTTKPKASSLGIIRQAQSIAMAEAATSPESISSLNFYSSSTNGGRESQAKDQVTLTPRLTDPRRQHHHINNNHRHPHEAFDWHRQYSFLSSSRSASHDAVDTKTQQQMLSTAYRHQVLPPNIDNPCPSLPFGQSDDDNAGRDEKGVVKRDPATNDDTTIFLPLNGSPSIPTAPTENPQSFHVGSNNSGVTTLKLSSPTSMPSSGRRTNAGKPVLCRSLAWSQDSQDERRITKRARMTLTTTTADTTTGTGMFSPSYSYDDSSTTGIKTRQLEGATATATTLSIANNSASHLSSCFPTTGNSTFDLDESWASNSSTSGIICRSGFGGRVRQAYAQPIVAQPPTVLSNTNINDKRKASSILRSHRLSSLSEDDPQDQHLKKEHSQSTRHEETMETQKQMNNETREEASPTMVHWCQKVNAGQDLMAQVHRIHHNRSIEQVATSPASISTSQNRLPKGQSGSETGSFDRLLQQPFLDNRYAYGDDRSMDQL